MLGTCSEKTVISGISSPSGQGEVSLRFQAVGRVSFLVGRWE